jgi:hypothetical protein
MKKWFKSKSVWFGLATVTGGAVVVGIQQVLGTNPMPEPWNGIVLSVVGAAAVYLRSVTDTGIEK